MIVTLNELKTDLERYLELVGEEEIVITMDGRQIASIMPPPDEREAMLRSLRGILPSTATLEEAHEERIAKYETHL
jgi:Phd_YefM.